MTQYFEKHGWNWTVITSGQFSKDSAPAGAGQVVRVGDTPTVDFKEPSLSELKGGWIKVLDSARRLKKRLNFYFALWDPSCLTWLRKLRSQPALFSEQEKPDLVIGSYPPAACLWFARDLAQGFGVPWVADFRDPGAVRDDPRLWFNRKLDLALEGHLLRSCAGLVTVSPTLARVYERTYRKPTAVVYNGFNDPEPRSGVECVADLDIHLDLYFAGFFYPHRCRALLFLMDALREVPGRYLSVRLLNDDFNEELLAYAETLGVRERLRILPKADPTTVAAEARHSKVNLILEDLNQTGEAGRGILTGKLMELLNQATPILAVAREDSDIGHVLKETGKGPLVASKEKIIEFLSIPSADACALYEGREDKIAYFSRRNQAAELCRFLDKILLDNPKTSAKVIGSGPSFDS